VKQLPVLLSDAERERKLREHIDLELEIEKLIAKRSEVNAEIRPKAKRSAELVHELDDGTVLRDIKCEIHELSSNEISIVRLDTGDEIERRTMTAAERQGQWDWAGAAQAKADEAKAAAASAKADDAGDLVEGDDEGAPLDGDEPEQPQAAARAPRKPRSSKGKPAKRSKGRSGRSAAAHA
jgi:hypothetical protein